MEEDSKWQGYGETGVPSTESDMALFKTKYNTTQKQLQAIAAMDDLLSGGWVREPVAVK